MPRPSRPLSQRRLKSPKMMLAAVLLLLGLLGSYRGCAQIVHEKPSQVKAANRRALREARRTESPYKDSHLTVTPARLRRGQSTPRLPESRDEMRYNASTAPRPHPSDRLDQRHKTPKP